MTARNFTTCICSKGIVYCLKTSWLGIVNFNFLIKKCILKALDMELNPDPDLDPDPQLVNMLGRDPDLH